MKILDKILIGSMFFMGGLLFSEWYSQPMDLHSLDINQDGIMDYVIEQRIGLFDRYVFLGEQNEGHVLLGQEDGSYQKVLRNELSESEISRLENIMN